MPTENAISYDLIIIGGGPAGMSAALVAGRSRLKTAVINAERPRNNVTKESHGFLTRDGAHPSELLEVAKEQLGKYPSVRYINGLVEGVSKSDSGFEVVLKRGESMAASRVIVATGYRDNFAVANLPGLEDVYGTSVFPCPFCDGFEHRDEKLALFGGQGVEHFAPMIKNWSADVVVFTNGETLEANVVEELRHNDVEVYQQPVERLRHEDGVLRGVELADGLVVERESGFLFADIGEPATDFAQSLGVGEKESPWGGVMLDADEHGKTSVKGLYVVGDARTSFSGLISAASEGSGCVASIVHEMSAERWKKL